MYKKLASAVVGVALLVSPLLVSAQSVNTSNASLIATLTALVQTLEQELQQLIAAQGSSTSVIGGSSNSSGIVTQPLAATCQGLPYNNGVLGVSWGSTPVGGTGSYTYHWTLANDVTGTGIGGDASDLRRQNLLATYSSAGMKSAQVTISDGQYTVTTGCSIQIGSGSSVNSASIDSSSQTQTSNAFSVTGSASGSVIYDGVTVYLAPTSDMAYANNYSVIAGQLGKDGFYLNNGGGMKTSGQWTAAFPYVNNGSYLILVYETQTKALLAQATLTVNSSAIPAQTNPVVINFFSVSPTSIVAGQPVTFSWGSNLVPTDISQYGGGCFISSPTNSYSELNAVGNSTNYGPSGSFTYTPTATATYTLNCYSGGKDGAPMAQRSLTIAVNNSTSQPTAAIWAVPSAVQIGTHSTIFWSSNNVSNCYEYSPLDGAFTGNSTSGGLATNLLTTQTTYNITCTGLNGQTVSNSVAVNATFPSGGQLVNLDRPAFYSIPNAPFSITGATPGSGISAILTVVIVSSRYTGATDWNSISGLLKGSSSPYTAVSNQAIPLNGRWSASFGGLPEDTYNIFVYDSSGNLVAGGIYGSTYKG